MTVSPADVSSRATASVIEVLGRWGVPIDGLDEGLSVDPAVLTSARHRITWDELTIFLGNVRDRVGPDRMVDIGIAVGEASAWEWPRRIAPYAVSPYQLFALGVRLFGPAVFPSVRSEVQHLPGGRIRVELRVPEGARPSVEFFEISRGHFIGFPRLLGARDSVVEADIQPTRAVYVVTPPPSRSLVDKALRLGRVLVGAPVALREVVRQQEELKLSYDALARSRRELHQLVEALPVGVGMYRRGVCVYANRSLAELAGYDDPRDLVGVRILDRVHPDDRAAVAERMARTEQTGEPQPPAEIRFFRRDGTMAIIESIPIAPMHYGGAPANVVVTRDVTEERRVREQLMVADRMASLGTLAAGVAHEINNPLTWLRGSLDIIDRELDRIGADGTPATSLAIAREAVKAAVDGASRVTTIVGDLRTFSRPSEEPAQTVHLEDVLESTLRVAAKQIHQRARLVTDLDELPPVLATPARLGQVFLNLILNAAQALPEGRAEEHEIRIHAYRRGDEVAIEIRDTGVGIPRHLLGRIFDPFFTTKPGEGTGLGLPISHAIVTRLGGSMEVESEPGVGTTMRVLLPAAGERNGARSHLSH